MGVSSASPPPSSVQRTVLSLQPPDVLSRISDGRSRGGGSPTRLQEPLIEEWPDAWKVRGSIHSCVSDVACGNHDIWLTCPLAGAGV